MVLAAWKLPGALRPHSASRWFPTYSSAPIPRCPAELGAGLRMRKLAEVTQSRETKDSLASAARNRPWTGGGA